MLVDGLTSSRPIVPDEVNTPADINALFDTISYNKGACIIRMINELAGQDAFVLGLKVCFSFFFFYIGEVKLILYLTGLETIMFVPSSGFFEIIFKLKFSLILPELS